MDSIRKWFYRPKKEDKSLLAQFFYADESLNGVACELDSFDGRQEPERCTSLVNQMRHCQDKVLSICNQIMDELIPDARANRDFRVKFPDDVMQENLAGQLWFGAECLAAGSSILNREAESSAMRPLAKALTKSLEIVRNLLREQALRGQTNLKAQNPLEPAAERLIESLKIFDRLFADFELCYVGAMVPVKSTKEYEQQELICVLFSETLQRALGRGLLRQADVDNYEPALMFTIPRLAIVAGLLAPPGGPLCLDSTSLDSISEMFRPFRSLLLKIRELLWTLNSRELYMLEKLLCSLEEAAPAPCSASSREQQPLPDLDDFVHNFYTGYPNCKDFIANFYTVTRNNGSNMDEVANDAVLILEQPAAGAATSARRHDSSGSSDFYSCDSVSVEMPVHQLSQAESTSSARSATTTTTASGGTATGSSANPTELASEANKSLSNLLLETDCQNELSEQTDSGICTVISSENTSLYDKSPEEKKSFANELEQSAQSENELLSEDQNEPEELDEEPEEDEDEEEEEEEEEGNTSYLCSNVFNSPKRRDSSKSDNSTSCVCSSRGSRASSAAYLTNSLEAGKQAGRVSTHLHGSSEEIVGLALGSGQIPVCDANQPTFQINYTENWENLNLNMESSSTRREFWSDLKCETCPTTSQKPLQQHYHQQERAASRKGKEEKQKRRRRKAESMSDETLAQQQQPSAADSSKRRFAYRASLQLPTSTESSRSNSTDRCLNPRLVNFGSSLHPSQNTRQMPSFGACSPRASPRMQHFESRTSSNSRRQQQQQQQRHHRNHHHHQHQLQQHSQRHPYLALNHSSHSRKLLEHRRQRSGEHSQVRPKRRESSRRSGAAHKLEHLRRKNSSNKHNNNNNSDSSKQFNDGAESDLINDGLGPRTNKSGIVTSERGLTCVQLNKQQSSVDASTSPCAARNDLTSSSSSCLSCCDSSSETSEFQSDCQDDEEIALAMQAAEIANRNQIRAKFRSSEDLVHRLFVCIAGVADQLQTNFASDLRNILKCVFLMNSSQSANEDEALVESPSDPCPEPALSSESTAESSTPVDEQTVENETVPDEPEPSEDRVTGCSVTERGEECVERAPVWVPDSVAPRCMACQAGFTVVRRRHHCRNCGKVFCGRCSSNNVPLPRFGHTKPVRVCNRCFIYQVTPFTVSQVAAASAS